MYYAYTAAYVSHSCLHGWTLYCSNPVFIFTLHSIFVPSLSRHWKLQTLKRIFPPGFHYGAFQLSCCVSLFELHEVPNLSSSSLQTGLWTHTTIFFEKISSMPPTMNTVLQDGPKQRYSYSGVNSFGLPRLICDNTVSIYP